MGINLLISIVNYEMGLFLPFIISLQLLHHTDLFMLFMYNSEGSLNLEVLPRALG